MEEEQVDRMELPKCKMNEKIFPGPQQSLSPHHAFAQQVSFHLACTFIIILSKPVT